MYQTSKQMRVANNCTNHIKGVPTNIEYGLPFKVMGVPNQHVPCM